jgi:hypothetical protein
MKTITEAKTIIIKVAFFICITITKDSNYACQVLNLYAFLYPQGFLHTDSIINVFLLHVININVDLIQDLNKATSQ